MLFEDIARDEKRFGYRQLCGTPHRLGDGKGGSRLVRFFCHQDECPTCQQIKGESYKVRVQGMMGAGQQVTQLKVDAESSEVIRKNMSKDDYLCLPQEDGTDILFIAVPDKVESGHILTEEDLGKLNWGDLTRRKEGRKISGGLGKPAAKVVKEREVIGEIEDTAYLFNNHELAEEVLHDVILQTKHLSAADVNAMQELVTQRNEMFEKIFKERGGVIISVFHKVVKIYDLVISNSIVNELNRVRTSDFNRKSFNSGSAEISEEDRHKYKDLVEIA